VVYGKARAQELAPSTSRNLKPGKWVPLRVRCYASSNWRGRLVVYGARLESGFTRKGIEGSNPSPSAKLKDPVHPGLLVCVERDSNASASGAQPPEARRPWEPGCLASALWRSRSNPSF
jgi:hypothetical protein